MKDQTVETIVAIFREMEMDNRELIAKNKRINPDYYKGRADTYQLCADHIERLLKIEGWAGEILAKHLG